MIYHTSPDGNLFSFAEINKRLVEKTNIFLFKNFYIIFLPFIIFPLTQLKKPKSFVFYPSIHLLIFSFHILAFQNDCMNRYFAALVPSLFIIIGVGSNDFLISKLNNNPWKQLKYLFITFVYVAFFLLSFPYYRYINDGSTNSFDDLVDGLNNSVLFAPNRPLISRVLLTTNLTAAPAWDPEFVKEILNSSNIVQSRYLVELGDSEHYLKRTNMILENFKTERKETKGYVTLYEILD